MEKLQSATHEEANVSKEISNDDATLISLGKKPEMERVFGFWSLCAFQVMYNGSWVCLVMLYNIIFDIGGPVGLVYGTIVVSVGQTILLLSLAEFCSIWPTAGGQQYWVQVVSPPKLQPIMSYVVGWFIVFTELATGAGCALNSAEIVAAFVQVTHPDVTWQPWMTWLLYMSFLLWPWLLNVQHKWQPKINLLGAIWVVLGGIAWAIVLGVTATPKASARFVFTTWINNSGYTSNFWVFIMSFYNPLYALAGPDGVLHLVEETQNASRTAPRAAVAAIIFSSFTAFLAALLLLWTSANWSSFMDADLPALDWFIDAMDSIGGGGAFFCLLVIALNLFACVAMNTAASRLFWSMARDKAFPYSKYLSYVSPTFGLPLRSLNAIVILELLLGLLTLGSTLAFESILSGAGIAVQMTYVLPILMVVIRGREILPPGADFSLGRWGYLVNWVGLLWCTLTIILYACPLYFPVTPALIDNMNWSVVIVGALIIFPGIYWICCGRFQYLRPDELSPNTVLVTTDGCLADSETRRGDTA